MAPGADRLPGKVPVRLDLKWAPLQDKVLLRGMPCHRTCHLPVVDTRAALHPNLEMQGLKEDLRQVQDLGRGDPMGKCPLPMDPEWVSKALLKVDLAALPKVAHRPVGSPQEDQILPVLNPPVAGTPDLLLPAMEMQAILPTTETIPQEALLPTAPNLTVLKMEVLDPGMARRVDLPKVPNKADLRIVRQPEV